VATRLSEVRNEVIHYIDDCSVTHKLAPGFCSYQASARQLLQVEGKRRSGDAQFIPDISRRAARESRGH